MQVPTDLDDADVQRMRSAIAEQRDHLDHPGQTFGYRYASHIILSEGADTASSGVGTYFPDASPDGCAPHVRLSRGRNTASTIGLFVDDGFTLLAGRGSSAWRDAFKRTAPALGVEAAAFTIGPCNDLIDHHGGFLEQYGIGSDGAVLVRPDGHAAWRSPGAASDPVGVMREVVRRTSFDARLRDEFLRRRDPAGTDHFAPQLGFGARQGVQFAGRAADRDRRHRREAGLDVRPGWGIHVAAAAGSAGCVPAARMSENERNRVRSLELRRVSPPRRCP